MTKKLRPTVDFMAFKCHMLRVNIVSISYESGSACGISYDVVFPCDISWVVDLDELQRGQG